MRGVSKLTAVDGQDVWIIRRCRIEGPFRVLGLFAEKRIDLWWLLATPSPELRWQKNQDIFLTVEAAEAALPSRKERVRESRQQWTAYRARIEREAAAGVPEAVKALQELVEV